MIRRQWFDVNRRGHPAKGLFQLRFDLFGNGVGGAMVVLDSWIDVHMHLDKNFPAVETGANVMDRMDARNHLHDTGNL